MLAHPGSISGTAKLPVSPGRAPAGLLFFFWQDAAGLPPQLWKPGLLLRL